MFRKTAETEVVDHVSPPRRYRWAKRGGAAVLAGLLLTACDTDSDTNVVATQVITQTVTQSVTPPFQTLSESAPAVTPSPAATGPVDLIPDMSHFLKGDSSTTCHDGGARPCYILPRTSDNLASPAVNQDPANRANLYYPHEAYTDPQTGQVHQGQPVRVDCYVASGQLIAPYDGTAPSSAWYAVEMPYSPNAAPSDYTQNSVINPVVRQQIQANDSTIRTVQHGDQTYAVSWASVEWFGSSTPDPRVQQCDFVPMN